MSKISELKDKFPVGMRVLAVDDDPTCLRLLDALLRRCQYHVTATNQASIALKLLKENKNKFDLIISDVHMPDMDGFKLLEQVGLTMDLPVIMLSANGDPKLVMKGITHGACDYLLKPVRIEELKNIWQHVIRRNKYDLKDHNAIETQDQPQNENCDGVEPTHAKATEARINKRRFEQNENVNEEHDDNEDYDEDDPSAPKKSRVVWSVELHKKFVAAVNQLGIDKAVPKKILDLMDEENLTRENVASHLQKYRLYLKRINCVVSQQAHMVAALGSTDSPYLCMGPSINGFGNYPPFQKPFVPFPTNGMIGRLSSPAVNMRGPYTSGMVQLSHLPNTNNTVNDWQMYHHNMIQPIPTPTLTPLEFHQTNNNTSSVSYIGDLPATMGNSVNRFMKIPISSPGNSMEQFGNQFSMHFQDISKLNGSCQGGVESSSMSLGDCFQPVNLHANSSRNDVSFITEPKYPGRSNQSLSDPNKLGNFNPTLCLNPKRNTESGFIEEQSVVNTFGNQCEDNNNMTLKSRQGYQNPQNSYACGRFGSLEDLVDVMMKQEEQDSMVNCLEGDFGCETYSIGTCM